MTPKEPSNANAKTFRVLSFRETVRPTQNGRFMELAEITFEHTSGFQGTVSLPKADATPDNVKAAIDAEIKRIEAILSL